MITQISQVDYTDFADRAQAKHKLDRMVIHRVFDEVFRSWSHVAVLRALLDTSTGSTGNEMARVSGMQPRSALKAHL